MGKAKTPEERATLITGWIVLSVMAGAAIGWIAPTVLLVLVCIALAALTVVGIWIVIWAGLVRAEYEERRFNQIIDPTGGHDHG